MIVQELSSLGKSKKVQEHRRHLKCFCLVASVWHLFSRIVGKYKVAIIFLYSPGLYPLQHVNWACIHRDS